MPCRAGSWRIGFLAWPWNPASTLEAGRRQRVHQRQEPDGLRRRVPDWIGLYLEEDLDGDGDVTSDAVFGLGDRGEARVVARERFFVSGLRHAAEVFRRRGCRPDVVAAEGDWTEEGAVLVRVAGPVRGILSAERLALNLLARMSGVATRTRGVVEALQAAGSGARAAGTRKTTPGFRVFEKEAILRAGGDPHRMGLFDEAMVKDNHAAAAGGVAEAVRRVRSAHPDLVVTAEAERLEDALAAADAGADWILIDNQDPATGKAWAEALRAAHPRIGVEASGGITEADAARFGWADRVSMGGLTQRARSVDVSLEWGAEGAVP